VGFGEAIMCPLLFDFMCSPCIDELSIDEPFVDELFIECIEDDDGFGEAPLFIECIADDDGFGEAPLID
jgi:hypothetical protein